MQLEKNIGELLYCHDCVIVPEFGGFVVNYRSAWVDELRNTIYPPSKEISFNRKLVRNDGLLTDHVSEVQNVSYDEANTRIAEQVGAWNKRLQSGERIELEGIGGLYLDQVQNLQFDPDKKHNYLTASFGMTAVQLPDIRTDVVEDPAPAVEDEVPVIAMPKEAPVQEEEEEQASKKVSFIPAAAATLALLIAFGFWLNTRTNVIQNGIAQFSALNPFQDSANAQYHLRPINDLDIQAIEHEKLHAEDGVEYFAYSFTEHANIANGRVVEWEKPEPAEPVNTFVKTVEAKERFHVVGGCFSVEKNAEGLIRTLQNEGYDPRLIDQHKGLYRVSIGSYISKQQALRALAAIRKEHTPSAWLLVK